MSELGDAGLIDDERAAAIGRVTIEFALLELTVESVIWDLLGIGKRTGEIVTSELLFRNLVQLLSALIVEKVKDEGVLKRFKELRKRIYEAEQQRNRIIHSKWFPGEGGALTRIKATAKNRGFELQWHQMPITDLIGISEYISEVTRDVFSFYVESICGVRLDSVPEDS